MREPAVGGRPPSCSRHAVLAQHAARQDGYVCHSTCMAAAPPLCAAPSSFSLSSPALTSAAWPGLPPLQSVIQTRRLAIDRMTNRPCACVGSIVRAPCNREPSALRWISGTPVCYHYTELTSHQQVLQTLRAIRDDAVKVLQLPRPKVVANAVLISPRISEGLAEARLLKNRSRHWCIGEPR